MRSHPRHALCGVLSTAALAMLATGCGGGSDAGALPEDGPAKDTPIVLDEGQRGGNVTFLAAGDIDFADPGQTYYSLGYMVLNATQRTLYAFEPDDAEHPVPDLAKGEPHLSADGRTVTVELKSGVRFAPPVNREVTSADVKYAFERAFTKQVPSGYAAVYFGVIEGTPEQPNSTGHQPISGIETPDDHTIVFRLSRPEAAVFSQALVQPMTAPVPEEYARPFDERNPSQYDKQVVATGPYMIANDAEGTLVGRRPGRQIRLVRNPNWDPATDFRPAYLDEIVVAEGNEDSALASRRTLEGERLLCCESGAPPVPVLRQALEQRREQVAFVGGGGTNYIALNTTIPPLDNVNVRRALLAGVNRSALRLTRGGPLLGDIATGFIPPGTAGFEEAGGLQQGSDYDFNRHPEGDPELARRYMLAAREDGVPVDEDGRYTGEPLLAVAGNVDPGRKTAEVAQAEFAKLGIELDLRLVPQETVYTKFCSVPAAKVAVCPTVSYFRDFPDPQTVLASTFGGDAIAEQGNVNWPQLDVDRIDAAMREAEPLPAGPKRSEAWAEIDDMVIGQAPAIPWMWSKKALLASADVDQIPNAYTGLPDLSFTSLR
jgi:peptide/nickel transport system substrate-binding protein